MLTNPSYIIINVPLHTKSIGIVFYFCQVVKGSQVLFFFFFQNQWPTAYRVNGWLFQWWLNIEDLFQRKIFIFQVFFCIILDRFKNRESEWRRHVETEIIYKTQASLGKITKKIYKKIAIEYIDLYIIYFARYLTF